MGTFEDLEVFQRAVELSTDIYRATDRFPAAEKYGLTAQMRGASISIISNIAEGQGRLSPGEWRQFLSQARGSLFEIDAQCIVARRLEFLPDGDCETLRAQVKTVLTRLDGLIAYVRRRERDAETRRRKRLGPTSQHPNIPTT